MSLQKSGMQDYYILCNSVKIAGKDNSSYMVKQIDDTLYKRLVHNEIHKKFSVQTSKQHLLKN